MDCQSHFPATRRSGCSADIPKDSDHPLQVAVARLLGYHWPRQTGSNFPDCPALNPDGLEEHAEADGIVCLTSLAGKASAADRLRALLADSYGEEWSATKLGRASGHAPHRSKSGCATDSLKSTARSSINDRSFGMSGTVAMMDFMLW